MIRTMNRTTFIIGALAFVACSSSTTPPAAAHDAHDDRHDVHDDDDNDVVEIADDAAKAAGIVAVAVTRTSIDGAPIPADVQFEPSSTAHIAPLVPGRFARVDVTLGQTVKRGQVLAVVTSSDASAARSRFEQANAKLTAATQTLTRQQQLSAEGIGAQRALVDAETEVRQLRAELDGLRQQLDVVGSNVGASGQAGELRLTSPLAGVVVEQHATLGEITAGTGPAFVVTDPARVQIRGLVPERRSSDVVVGAAVVVRFVALPDTIVHGHIAWVAPGLDDEHRLPIRVTLDRVEGASSTLRGGLSGTISLVDGTTPIAVPAAAVTTVRGSDVVFVPVKEKPGQWRARPVRTGRRRGGLVVVDGGLVDGDVIAGAGAFTLKSVLLASERSTHEH